MRIASCAIAFLFVTGMARTPAEDVPAILQRQAQELVDAITSGSAEVWDRLLDDGAVITAEDGSVSTKAAMLKDIRPLPEGVSGRIRVTDFHAYVHGQTAIATYVDDEDETYHGHVLHCQYRVTDTWQKTGAGWRLIGSQVLALRTDPPAIQLPAADLAAYAGRYALAPDIAYEIRVKDGKLEGQRTGRAAEPLLAEAPDVLFVPGSPRYRKLMVRDAEGRVTAMVERREAWDLPWTRVP